MRRIVFALLLLSLSATASAAWYPSLDGNMARIEVGETVTVRVRAIWTGLMVIPWMPWTFESSNPDVARVQGQMLSSQPGEMRITGVSPGHARGLIRPMSAFYSVDVTVVCGKESPIQAAEPQQTAKTGEAITLRAVTPIANRTTFTWYHGLVGDMSAPIAGSGPEIAFATNDPGTHYAWVLATTPCSSTTAQFEIDAVSPRRRSARH
jgi:hypothetical protein